MLFRRIVLCALMVGALSGLLMSVVQQFQVIPIIEAAEALEAAGVPSAAAGDGHADAQVQALSTVHANASSNMHAPSHSSSAHTTRHSPLDAHAQALAHADTHAHDDQDWAPQDGAERHLWTLLANVLTATGFALLLIPAIAAWESLRAAPRASARNGLVWGIAAWACVFAVPALGLPPEIPGSAAAALHERQAWWLLAVGCAAGACALLAFARHPWRWLAAALLAIPFAVGAPHLEVGPFAGYGDDIAARMQALAGRFTVATAIANAIYWLALGSLAGAAVARWIRPALAEHRNHTLLSPTTPEAR